MTTIQHAGDPFAFEHQPEVVAGEDVPMPDDATPPLDDPLSSQPVRPPSAPFDDPVAPPAHEPTIGEPGMADGDPFSSNPVRPPR
jgi:hypothetical protein